MTSPYRRIVTGHDAAGRSIVVSDGPTPNVLGGLSNFWTTPKSPPDLGQPDPMLGPPHGLHPPKGGTLFRFFEIQPDRAFEGVPAETLWANTRARFVEMGAEDALVDTTRHPAMHTTHTIDYIILLRGEVTLLLDEADVPMKPFDVVIQRGTNHAWRNTGEEPALLVAVLVDAAG